MEEQLDNMINNPSWFDSFKAWFAPRTKIVFWTGLVIVFGLITLWYINKPSHLENWNTTMKSDQYMPLPIREGTSDLTVITFCGLGAGLIIAYFLAIMPINKAQKDKAKAKKKLKAEAEKKCEQEARDAADKKAADQLEEAKRLAEERLQQIKDVQLKADDNYAKALAEIEQMKKDQFDNLKISQTESQERYEKALKEINDLRQKQFDKIEADKKKAEDDLSKVIKAQKKALDAKIIEDQRRVEEAKVKVAEVKTKADRTRNLEEKVEIYRTMVSKIPSANQNPNRKRRPK